MRRNPSSAALLVALALAGCGENAAENVPKAVIAPAKPIAPNTIDAPATTAAPAVSATPVPAGALAITPVTSKIEFVGSKKVGESHKGGFKMFNGVVEMVPGKPEVKSISVDIDTASIFADNDKLTGHLKNQDFFEVTKFPTAKFVTTEIKTGGDKGATHTIVGNLTLHGVTKSITIPAVVKVEGDALTLKSEFALNKNDFGMTFGGPGGVIRKEVVIRLDIKAAKGA